MSEHLTIVADAYEPWIYFIDLIKGKCIGIQCEIINYLSRSLNISYNIITVSTGAGTLLPNNTWTGFFGKFINNVR